MRILLWPISFLYSIVLTIRHKFYDWRIFKSLRFDYPTIGVGNLNLGGTGKTPTVEYLINLLKGSFKVATLSRGYGRTTKGFQRADNQSTSKTIGDEPLQYFHKFPDIQVAVNKDRVEGVRKLLRGKETPDVILLDDAYQHRSLKVELNLLLTEYHHLYCDDFLFPTGTLRDVKLAAKRADIIVVSKSPIVLSDEDKKLTIKKLNPTVYQKVFFSYLEYGPLKPLNEAAKHIEFGKVDSVLLFCGIAHPELLIEELSKQFQKLDTLTFADHHPYGKRDINHIIEHYQAMQGERKIIVTTEKDAARLTNSPYLCQFEATPLLAQPIGVRFHEEEKFNEEILNYVRENKHHC